MRTTVLAVTGWALVVIGLFFALWVTYLLNVVFSACGILFCHWTADVLLRILTITALPMGLGVLLIRYDEMRRNRVRKSKSVVETRQHSED